MSLSSTQFFCAHRAVLKLMYCLFCFPTGVFTAAFDCGIEWLIVKGIADYADGSQLASAGWSSCASVMAASLVAHMLSEPRVFHSWLHYQGNHAIIKCCHILASDLLNPRLGSFHSAVTDKLHGTSSGVHAIPNSAVQHSPRVQGV